MAWPEWKTQMKGSEAHYVYAIMCKDEDGPGYIKFGRSRRIMERLTEIRTACPVPVKVFAVVEVGAYRCALRTEKYLHRRFKERRIRGEWYRFDFKDPGDKRDFNEGTQAVFMETIGHLPGWTKLSVKELDRMNDARRQAWRESKSDSEMQRIAKRRAAKRARQRELAAYRHGLRSDG